MPCGRMSIASRSLSCDLRAPAIAASASARMRTISPISLTPRRNRIFGAALTTCPTRVGHPLAFGFFFASGRNFGIVTSTRILRDEVCEGSV